MFSGEFRAGTGNSSAVKVTQLAAREESVTGSEQARPNQGRYMQNKENKNGTRE